MITRGFIRIIARDCMGTNVEWDSAQIKSNGLLGIAGLMLDYSNIEVMCLQLITLRIVWVDNTIAVTNITSIYTKIQKLEFKTTKINSDKMYKKQSHGSLDRLLHYRKWNITDNFKAIGNERFLKSDRTHLDEFIRFSMSEFVNNMQITFRW